jgi:thiol-disulfide isomerase/thioredoxin
MAENHKDTKTQRKPEPISRSFRLSLGLRVFVVPHISALRIVILLLLLPSGCGRTMPEQATWKGTVELANGKISLPFQMFLDLRSAKPTGYFLVGDERTPIPEITRQGDSLTFGFSEYGAEMRGTWNGSQLNGTYVRRRGNLTTSLTFSASPEVAAADLEAQPSSASPADKYQVYFEGQDRNESATVVATLWKKGQFLYGTFIAPDGDYGLLAGKASGGEVQLSRFTGWQAIAIMLQPSGTAWSGNYYFQNDKPRAFTLEPRAGLDVVPLPRQQTAMKNAEAGFTFEGISVTGETVRSSDGRFKGKPLVVDIMGTWCHNCIDGAPVLEELQTQYGKDGLQVVGISFEVNDDPELGKKNLKLYKDRFGITYTLLFCGSTDDANVNRRLRNQLSNFFAYPTTLFIGRDGKVKTIHSGFKGPGTGEEFKSQVREFHELAEKLLNNAS